MINCKNINKRTFITLSALSFMAMSVSGCSIKWKGWDALERDPLAFMVKDKKEDVTTPPPPSIEEQKDIFLDSVTPIELKRGGSTGSLGLKLDTYFDLNLSNEERLSRIERAVVAMQKDIAVIAPVAKDMRQHMAPNNHVRVPAGTSIQAPIATTSPTPTPTSTNTPIPLTTKDQAKTQEKYSNNIPPPAPAATGPQDPVNKGPRPLTNTTTIVSGIRVGEHPDRMRVVFDVTQKTSYNADLDNNEKILIVEMPNARWNTPTTFETFGKMPIVKSYKIEPLNNGAGNIFILQLKKATTILHNKKYPALSGNGERIVIDLKK